MTARSRALAVGSLVAMAFLAGAADHAAAGTGPIPIPREPLVVAAQTGLWLLVAADVLLLIVIVYAVATDRSPIVAEPRSKRSLASYLAPLIPMLIALALLYLRRPGGGGVTFFGPLGLGSGLPRSPVTNHAQSQAGGDTIWFSLLLAVIAVAIFLAWLFWPHPRRSRPRLVSVAPEAPEPMAEAVDESIEALRAIADPRQAIVAAYSSMETSLTRAGVPRGRADTPLEFLARALSAVLGTSPDARRLTHLFEFAKFSRHEVDESLRSDALLALQNIRAQISPAATT